MIKLSIIVPVYNVQPFLRECLDSIIQFNDLLGEKFELICINDGSTDESLKIIHSYQRKFENLRIINKQNEGLSKTRNVGLELAIGEYITFIDSDDWYTEDAAAIILNSLNEYSPDILICNFNEYYEDGKIVEHEEKFQTSKLMYFQTCWNKVFKSELIKDIKFPVGLWYEDNQFTYCALMKTNSIKSVNLPILNYRKNRPGSIMNSQKSQKIFDINSIYSNILFYSQDLNISLTMEDKIALEYLFVQNCIFRIIPKIIKNNISNPFIIKKQIKKQFAFVESSYPNWTNNEMIINDVDKYYFNKIGINHIKKIKKLEKRWWLLFIYRIEVLINEKIH